ncbi:hypothetical protein TSOC_009719 [Tetrabaena socialis]|uniref:Uncharacterized protein n=1 Tax=Tetrabaena socialis TaxID=47790 RepID=A0A2J7ZV65_9CHLO|nr:hypothetical protein TSOC_009719 [Tetrabaena socialis]|eukprot:PNH04149.1 hypothetical protein TSOC_009719 [Tetrabaena socialis]
MKADSVAAAAEATSRQGALSLRRRAGTGRGSGHQRSAAGGWAAHDGAPHLQLRGGQRDLRGEEPGDERLLRLLLLMPPPEARSLGWQLSHPGERMLLRLVVLELERQQARRAARRAGHGEALQQRRGAGGGVLRGHRLPAEAAVVQGCSELRGGPEAREGLRLMLREESVGVGPHRRLSIEEGRRRGAGVEGLVRSDVAARGTQRRVE